MSTVKVCGEREEWNGSKLVRSVGRGRWSGWCRSLVLTEEESRRNGKWNFVAADLQGRRAIERTDRMEPQQAKHGLADCTGTAPHAAKGWARGGSEVEEWVESPMGQANGSRSPSRLEIQKRHTKELER